MAESSLGHEQECCMCGDLGFPNALFHCRICLFRSQHKYCSDLYPKAESYHICNWCLHDKENRPVSLSTADDSSASSEISSNGTKDDDVMGLKRKIGGFHRRLSVQILTVKKNKFDDVDHKKREEARRKTTAMEDGKKDGGRTMGRRRSRFGRKEELILARAKDSPNLKIGTPKPIGRGKVRRYKL